MTEKLVFTRPSPHRSGNKHPTIHINTQLYDTLVSISDATGLPISAVANRMLEFAATHTEIVDCYPISMNKNSNCVIYGG